MADNFPVTPGIGMVIATDDIGGVHYPIQKLTFGALDSSTLVSLTNGLPVQSANIEKAEDTAHTSGDKGIMFLGVRQDTIGSMSSTSGDYTPLSIDANGRQRVIDQFTNAEGATPVSVINPTDVGVSLSGATCCLTSLSLFNGDTVAAAIKLYDKATAASAADTPKIRTVLAAGASVSMSYPKGLHFANGISVRSVHELTDAGTTSSGTNTVLANAGIIT